jgi:hypothetical protein
MHLPFIEIAKIEQISHLILMARMILQKLFYPITLVSLKGQRHLDIFRMGKPLHRQIVSVRIHRIQISKK